MKKVFNVLTGMASLSGFGVSVVFTYVALRSDIQTDLIDIVVLLTASLSILAISAAFMFYYLFKESKSLQELPRKHYDLQKRYDRQRLLVSISAENFHNIAHYYRNTICDLEHLEHLLAETVSYEPEEMAGLDLLVSEPVDNFVAFLNTLTTNLQSYFEKLTGHRCTVTIKITKYEGNRISKVKTFYRDPISYRKRRKSDRTGDGSQIVFDVQKNTAYNIIADPGYADTSFLCDDLKAKWEAGDYQNSTVGWMNLYNACAVAAISKRVDGSNERDILGFLCVDNDNNGSFENSLVENYLNGIADMLYILFEKFDNVVRLAIEREIDNEVIEIYSDWNTGR